MNIIKKTPQLREGLFLYAMCYYLAFDLDLDTANQFLFESLLSPLLGRLPNPARGGLAPSLGERPAYPPVGLSALYGRVSPQPKRGLESLLRSGLAHNDFFASSAIGAGF